MDIDKFFSTSSEPVLYFFNQQGLGYYIPLYQRKYSWDQENIEQLMDDICSGVSELLVDKESIHFMGTIILVEENDRMNNIKPQEPRALPTRIDNVIDGQQRISTIALLGCCLYQNIYIIKNKLKLTQYSNSDSLIKEVQEAADEFLVNLLELFSFEMKRGTPKYKPLIIRGSLDSWTIEGKEIEHYKSPISSYLADFIKATHETQNTNHKNFPSPVKNSLVAKNIKSIQEWLDQVIKSFEGTETNYPPAWEIVEQLDTSELSELWGYEYPNLFETVKQYKNIKSSDLDKNKKNICSLVQLFMFSSYLLKRCCFTVIKPVSQVRAFDMFQSLNATGTPLTAIETFKPLVVNIADSQAQGFKNSNFDKYFTKIEDLMEKLRSASSKNQRTNEYLTLFCLTYEGKSLSKQFSLQRKWLIEQFEKGCSSNSKDCDESSLAAKEEFIHQMGDVAIYCKKIIYSQANSSNSLSEFELLDEPQRKLASFCLLYLQDANHKMAHTILSRFYALAIRPQNDSEDLEEENQKKAQENFATACKIVAAFFTLWRSALPNTGLDNVYRSLLQQKMSWKQGNSEVTLENLKTYFKNTLQDKGIGTEETWLNKAINYLRYDNVQKVCRFVLFITSQDTIPDSDEIGLMKIGKTNSSSSYLEPSQWISADFKSIEHIAPRKPDLQTDATWDTALYDNDDYEQIGNLTLLPTEINSSASNKQWTEKWIYYRHLAEVDPDKLSELKREAENNGVNLNDSTIKLLTQASHAHHIKPIVKIGATGKWDKEFVERRTKRICEILWKRLYEEWLS